MLPFTAEVYFSVLERYNGAVWPAQIFAYGLALAAVAMAWVPFSGSGRAVAGLLAAAWAWIGAVFHLDHFATINFAAPAYGALFIAQALLVAWTGLLRGRLDIGFTGDPYGWAGFGFAAYALVVYPLTAWLAGHGWPQTPLVGLAGAPTIIFTIGLLLLVRGRAPVHLAVIPVIWSLIAGATAWVLATPEDIAVPVAGLGGLALILRKNARARAVAG